MSERWRFPQKGDRIRVVDKSLGSHGRVGVIAHAPNSSRCSVTVRLDGDTSYYERYFYWDQIEQEESE